MQEKGDKMLNDPTSTLYDIVYMIISPMSERIMCINYQVFQVCTEMRCRWSWLLF